MSRISAFRRAVVVLACTMLAATVVPAAAADRSTWSIRPSAGNRTVLVSGDAWRLPADAASLRSAGSTERFGTLTFPQRRFAKPVDTVRAAVDASIPAGAEAAVDVRGLRVDGTWSEWTEARPERAAVLPVPARVVQARLVLAADGASPQVREIDLTASRTTSPATVRAEPNAGRTYRVFATREGLVGGTTANGHVIVRRDHFVALPTRRGLADRGSGDYTVRVCTQNNARCEWAPVWDVGPWNTKDDYWNPAAEREMWRDLPQGRPQSQAAYQDGHNGGRDQFGRRVANPAAIDLADGTFWDGLRLSDNSWVTVSYQWTGDGPSGTIAIEASVLNVRANATSTAAQTGLAARHAQVRIDCYVMGQSVTGTQGTTSEWYRLGPNRYVSAAYVEDVAIAGAC